MLGSFLLELRHLSLDHPGIDPVPPYRIIGALVLHLPEQALIPRLETLGRRAVALWQPTLQDLEAAQERQPIRVQTDRLGRLEHQRSRHEMTQRQGIDLLDHPRWGLAPQMRRRGRTPRILMRLLLVID